MAFDIKIRHDLESLTKEIGRDVQAIVKGARTGINRGMKRVKTQSVKVVRETKNVEAATLRRRIVLKNARGSSLDVLVGKVFVDDRKINLIAFARNKKPVPQKGITPSKRRKIQYAISKGKVRQHKRAFIAIGKGGKRLVFQRTGRKQRPIAPVNLPGIASTFDKPRFQFRLSQVADPLFNLEVERAIQFFLNKSA